MSPLATHYSLTVAVIQSLDDELDAWFRGDPKMAYDKKRNTYINKYLRFCAATDTKIFPISLLTFCRYAKWLPNNNINSGWKGVKNYVGALAQYNVSLGGQDPREENPALWALLRTRFTQNVTVTTTVD